MQTVSAGFTAASQAAGQKPITYVEVSWDGTGSIAGARGSSGWTDETDYLVSHTGTLRINPPGEQLIPAGSVGTATVILSNDTQRFSWQRTDGPLYAYIGGAAGLTGKQIRIWQGFLGEGFVCIFTGLVRKWQERPDATVVLDCGDWGWRYLQDRRSSTVNQDQLPSAWINTVATAAGISGGLMNLDTGIFVIPYVWMDDESVVEEIWEAAASDGGVAYFDQLGVLRYENILHWVNLSSVWTFDEGTYQLSEPSMDADDVATKIIVEYAARYPRSTVNLYEQEIYRLIPPGETIEFVARFDYAAVEVFTPDPAAGYEDYYVSSLGGIEMTDDVTITLSNIYAQQATVTVANGHATLAARLDVFRIRGIPLIGAATEQASADASPAPYPFERTRSVRGNPYNQTLEQSQAIANTLALRSRRVRPVWVLRDVPGVPQLELGDLTTFQDTRALGTGESIDGLVIGIQWRAGLEGFWQAVTLMDVTDLSEYDSYFVIGTDTLGANARIYY